MQSLANGPRRTGGRCISEDETADASNGCDNTGDYSSIGNPKIK